jgi:hypothetical protein
MSAGFSIIIFSEIVLALVVMSLGREGDYCTKKISSRSPPFLFSPLFGLPVPLLN